MQKTFNRLLNFSLASDIVTVTNIKHFQNIKLQLNKIDKSNVVIDEPLGRNTAPAIAATLEYFKQKDSNDAIVLIVPSDHLICDINGFNETVKKVITIGI